MRVFTYVTAAACPQVPVRRSVPDRAHPYAPATARDVAQRGDDFAAARRTETALVHSMSTEISTETALHSALVSENAAKVSKEATVASGTAPAKRHQIASRQPIELDDDHLPNNYDRSRPRRSGRLPSPAKPEMAGACFRPSSTSTTPTAPCHPPGP